MRPKKAMFLAVWILLTLVPPAIACNPFTFTIPTAQNPYQEGVFRLAAAMVEMRTGLSIKTIESNSYDDQLKLYNKAKIDLLGITPDCPQEAGQRALSLDGFRVETEAPKIILFLHPETEKLFPKMKDLLADLVGILGSIEREELIRVVGEGEEAVKTLLKGRQ